VTGNLFCCYAFPGHPEFIIGSRLVKKHGRPMLVDTSSFAPEDTVAAFALATMREVKFDRLLGDV
jgi:hypothetical protein